MSGSQMTPEILMAKADTACSSARLLLESGDEDGAVNRAYYAMFDAARAALLAVKAPIELETVRTHVGLIGAFGNFLVKNGPLSKNMGRQLSQALKIRFMADYTGDSIAENTAREIVAQAEMFVNTLRVQFSSENDAADDGPRP